MEGKDIGFVEGRDKKEAETVIQLYKKRKTVEEISDLLDIDLARIQNIIQNLT